MQLLERMHAEKGQAVVWQLHGHVCDNGPRRQQGRIFLFTLDQQCGHILERDATKLQRG
jgi:hypothetical protein